MTSMEQGTAGWTIGALKKQGCFESENSLVVTLNNVEEIEGKIKCILNDGNEDVKAVVTSQLTKEYGSALKESSRVVVTDGTLNKDGEDNDVLVVTGIKILQESNAQRTPVALSKTPAPAVRKPDVIKTPVSKAQPISTLNPYLHGWSIKAKVLSKGPKRSFSNRNTGQAQSVFSVEIVDQEGTSIEATFWRDGADRFYEKLEEGKAYSFSRGSVKPANKNYNRTRNDYCLHFDGSSTVDDIEEHIDANAMKARMNFVAIDQLPVFVDKKAPVDVIGVVTAVGAPGSVKRKSDSTEVQRRDVTIADPTLKTVVLTLWGERADSEGEILNNMLVEGKSPILAASACRVSSYNGVTLSTGMRSSVLIDPEMDEAQDLKSWYEVTGATSALNAVGEGVASAAKPAARRYFDLSEIEAKAPVTPDDKPVYATVNAMLAFVNPDQSLYYLACPENNRKVVEQGPGEYYCEYDGKTYPQAVRRYVAAARVIDDSGILPAQIFNDQAEIIFGKKADRMHEIRESDAAAYKAALVQSQWNEWTMRVKCQAQEYNGEIRKRYAIIDAQPVNYAKESRRILQLIEQTV
jgi:replication factor A1